MTRPTTGYRLLDHTADLALEVWAPDEGALLREAASALTALMTEDAKVQARATVTVTLETLNREERLVQWLNEVLYLAVTRGFLYADARIQLRGDGLDAQVAGEPDAAARIQSELKSVTYHDLSVRREAGGWNARVVIDV